LGVASCREPEFADRHSVRGHAVPHQAANPRRAAGTVGDRGHAHRPFRSSARVPRLARACGRARGRATHSRWSRGAGVKMLAYTFPGAHGQLYPLSSILPAPVAHGDDCCACTLPDELDLLRRLVIEAVPTDPTIQLVQMKHRVSARRAVDSLGAQDLREACASRSPGPPRSSPPATPGAQ
jgi:hypothetical protein